MPCYRVAILEKFHPHGNGRILPYLRRVVYLASPDALPSRLLAEGSSFRLPLRLPRYGRDQVMNPVSQRPYFARFNLARAGMPVRALYIAGLALIFATLALIGMSTGRAAAAPALVLDLASGSVLYEDRATEPWYPASLTKLMTTYVALSAVRDHRIAFDTPIIVSSRAASMAPSS